MTAPLQWLFNIDDADPIPAPDGVVPARGTDTNDWWPEEIVVMEKARYYKADAVFFEPRSNGQPAVAQAFIYRSDSPEDPDFPTLHKRLWSWGGVPLVYRATPGLVQLFRCAHKPDFEKDGKLRFSPFDSISTATLIADNPWWEEEQLRKGTLWDDPDVCKQLLSSSRAALKTLITEVKDLYEELGSKRILPRALGRRLLILSILIAYLEARKVFEEDYFDQFLPGAESFFQVLADGPALVELLEHLENRFNGHVFVLKDEERELLRTSNRLGRFARLVEGKQEPSGQRTLWERYSFADLPVEFISHVYQLFVEDKSVAVYTPHFLVRLMLSEILSWERLDRLEQNDEVIVDGACGSGIFLVEAYKRLVLHWRQRNGWKRPSKSILQRLATKRIRGIDLDEGAVELTAFSLCLAMCDALEPAEIRASVHLFPQLKGKTVLTGCFFDTVENNRLKNVGVAVGNPPFKSQLTTPGAERSSKRFQLEYGDLPDKQLAYLFIYESMKLLQPGGVLSMLQTYGFLYNQNSGEFRKRFIERWDVREILDFVSVRGLFKKSNKDTKVLVIVAEATPAPSNRQILHATFRRSGRVDAEQGFDVDYYDMHWIPREMALREDDIWRSNLLGGGRILDFVKRLRRFRTLGKYADELGWDHGEGFVEGARGVSRPAKHIIGKRLLPSEAITIDGIDRSQITNAKKKSIEGPRNEARFTPPMLLIREHMDLYNEYWVDGYLTYKNKVVGFSASIGRSPHELEKVATWIRKEIDVLRAYAAAVSVRLFTQKATTLSGIDIENLPYPENQSFNIPKHERIIISDVIDYYRDLVRLGDDSPAMTEPGTTALREFNEVFETRISAVYKRNKLRTLTHYEWPGVICQIYAFGRGELIWKDEGALKGRIDALLKEKHGAGLNITRIGRIYDGNTIILIKPNRLRYWLRSIALRDSDEVLADLAEQGF